MPYKPIENHGLMRRAYRCIGGPERLAAAGNPDVTKQLLDGCTVGGKPYHVHLDGYDQIPYLTGEAKESPRNAIMYFSDDGEVMAVRVGDYKFHLAVQRAQYR